MKNTQLAPIIRAVLFRSNKAQLGQSDDDDGNFGVLLCFVIGIGNSALNEHFKTANANATYVNKNIKNQIIDAIGALITKNIVHHISKSQCFAVCHIQG